jgi:hypothetical protein
MKFEYKKFHDIERPVIPITRENPRTTSSPTIGCEALVDSGSDRSIFSNEIGELLGIDIIAGHCVYVGGVVAHERRPMYLHRVVMTVGGFAMPPLRTTIAVMPDLSPNGPCILGRVGFFDRFSFGKFRDFDSKPRNWQAALTLLPQHLEARPVYLHPV